MSLTPRHALKAIDINNQDRKNVLSPATKRRLDLEKWKQEKAQVKHLQKKSNIDEINAKTKTKSTASSIVSTLSSVLPKKRKTTLDGASSLAKTCPLPGTAPKKAKESPTKKSKLKHTPATGKENLQAVPSQGSDKTAVPCHVTPRKEQLEPYVATPMQPTILVPPVSPKVTPITRSTTTEPPSSPHPMNTPLTSPIVVRSDSNEDVLKLIERQKEEIKNLKTALSLLQSGGDYQQKHSEEVKQLRRSVLKNEQYASTLQRCLKSTLQEKQQLEAELEKKQQKIDQLHNHIAELAVLYEVSSSTVEEQEMTIDTMNSSNANVNRVIKSFLKEREECYARVSTELQQAKEEIHALRFTNELLIQKIGETRGKFVSQLQKVHKEHKTVEEDLKADAAAWNELMNTTVKQLQENMSKGLKESVEKISMLETQLSEERVRSDQLKAQLQELQNSRSI